MTVEDDDSFIYSLVKTAGVLGFKVSVTNRLSEIAGMFNSSNLTIFKANRFEDIGDFVFGIADWSMIINDGISRSQVNYSIANQKSDAIIIFDNVEYCANWGRLDRASAEIESVKSYRQILRDPLWRHYLFEQAEGREGGAAPDVFGWEAPHRWISAVLWRYDHLFAKLMVSNIGLPLVTIDGANDEDVLTLNERCPYDWSEMKWLVDEYSNVFKLERKYE